MPHLDPSYYLEHIHPYSTQFLSAGTYTVTPLRKKIYLTIHDLQQLYLYKIHAHHPENRWQSMTRDLNSSMHSSLKYGVKPHIRTMKVETLLDPDTMPQLGE